MPFDLKISIKVLSIELEAVIIAVLLNCDEFELQFFYQGSLIQKFGLVSHATRSS